MKFETRGDWQTNCTKRLYGVCYVNNGSGTCCEVHVYVGIMDINWFFTLVEFINNCFGIFAQCNIIYHCSTAFGMVEICNAGKSFVGINSYTRSTSKAFVSPGDNLIEISRNW